MNYKINSKIDLIFDYTHYYYLAQQPGGLTDAMYKDDYLQSIRDRNWFSVSWNLPSATFTYKKNSKLEFQSKTFELIANRKA
ncbi:MAG: TonB-dependent receptor, partial [Flavobacteriales bacterium]